ncbi:MAG: hypothetical protein GJU77_04375 [Ferrovum sp.]|jgi:hypothetical protein|nr:hypothetical protein [Ferrovum sp.]
MADYVELYAKSLGFAIKPRTVLVEGTTDVDLFRLAARLEYEKSGINLLNDDVAIVAAGERERGGTNGVMRELFSFRGMARTCLLQNGTPRYRFIGLLDNDFAGRKAVKSAQEFDNSILEYKDIFRLWPTMPLPGNLDQKAVKTTFEKANSNYKGLDWEMEDLLPQSFVEAFKIECESAVRDSKKVEEKIHWELTRDGKAKFHQFIKENALHADMSSVIDVLRAIRHYLNSQKI